MGWCGLDGVDGAVVSWCAAWVAGSDIGKGWCLEVGLKSRMCCVDDAVLCSSRVQNVVVD
jgi:hypothetical protein